MQAERQALLANLFPSTQSEELPGEDSMVYGALFVEELRKWWQMAVLCTGGKRTPPHHLFMFGEGFPFTVFAHCCLIARLPSNHAAISSDHASLLVTCLMLACSLIPVICEVAAVASHHRPVVTGPRVTIHRPPVNDSCTVGFAMGTGQLSDKISICSVLSV